MTTLIKHKRVEFSELFYDLVFVFAISKVTTLIDHLHNGILTWNSFLDFFIATLFLIDSWMIQTDYTNRYGKNSLFNYSNHVYQNGNFTLYSQYDWT